MVVKLGLAQPTMRWAPIVRQPGPAGAVSQGARPISVPATIALGATVMASVFLLLNVNPLVVVVLVGIWAKAQSVGEADRPQSMDIPYPLMARRWLQQIR
jgi:hypothetical protein